MKHPFSVTALLVFLFVAAQIVGLGLVFLNMHFTIEDGVTSVTHDTTAIGDRPDFQGGQSLLFIAIGVAIGTGILLLLIRLKAFGLWKAWFLLAVLLSLFVAFDVIMPRTAAFLLAAALALWKVFRPNAIVHNLTELFIYGGIAVLIAPLFDLWWAVALLAAISAYDMYAVWRSKHMVKLAEAQTHANLFAGLYVPKRTEAPKAVRKTAKSDILPPSPPRKPDIAILGGGDIAFPLIFSCVVLVWLIETRNLLPVVALYESLIVTAGATLALALLFWRSEKGKFYPAMPFLSAGCLLGFAIVSLL